MGKGPKLHLSFLNSIQICRADGPSTLVKTPLPRSHISKTYDISLPTFPDPPSSPDHLFTNDSQHEPKLCIMHENFPTQAYTTVKREDKQKLNEGGPAPKKERNMMKKPRAKANASANPTPRFNQSEEQPLDTSEKSARRSSVHTHRFKRYGSKDGKDSSLAKVDEGHRQVNESFVVLKRSADPYLDFKKSMLEMIVERRIFEPRDLELLLMSFLSLNSRMHHKAILKAFSEIWKEVFSGMLC